MLICPVKVTSFGFLIHTKFEKDHAEFGFCQLSFRRFLLTILLEGHIQ
jgi:hypothetical protein